MAKEIIDLWPEGIETRRITAPVTILHQQAALLGQRTRNLVTAEVFDRSSDSNEHFTFGFYLVAPALGDYQYSLLTIAHDIGLYPVSIYVEDLILDEIDLNFERDLGHYEGTAIIAKTEEEFQSILKQVFRSQKSFQVITSLLSQSDPDWNKRALPGKPATEEDDIPF